MKRVIASFLPLALFANEVPQDLLLSLNAMSDLATEVKLNVDKTPSTIQIVDRKFIEACGARTLFEILAYLPGFEIAMTSSGKRQLIVRGVKNAYRDKIKLLIDGVSVKDNLYNNLFYYYNFPAALIKRIEITKSPSSLVYGDNAFLGVINVITYGELDSNRLALYMSDQNQLQLSGFVNKENLLVDFYVDRSNPSLQAPPTILIDLQRHAALPFRSSLQADPKEKTMGFGLRKKIGSASLTYRLNYYQKGNFFGISRLAPQSHDQNVHLLSHFLRIEDERFLRPDLKQNIEAHIKHYRWFGAFRTFPYTLKPEAPPQEDLIIGAHINDLDVGLKVGYKYFLSQHTLSCAIEASYAKPYKFWYDQYIPSNPHHPLNLGRHLTGSSNVLKEGIDRMSLGLSIDDLAQFDTFTLFYGARVDHYSDFKTHLSYEAGIAYFPDEKSTFKLIYSNAFRAPSWVELYAKSAAEFNGNPSLKPETIDLVELMAKSKSSFGEISLTYYYGKNRDTIIRDYDPATGKRVYQNKGSLRLQGLEAQWRHPFTNGSLTMNYSLNLDKASYTEYIGSRKHLFHLLANYKWKSLGSFSSLSYGSKAKTPPYVEDTKAYLSIDQVLSFKNKNTTLLVGVKNITDHRNTYWIAPSDIIAGHYMFEYAKAEVPTIGRTLFISYERRW